MASRIVLYSSLLMAVFGTFSTNAASKNGFDLEGSLIPVRKILSGGPPRDGIPALINPAFVTAEMATYLKEDDRVLAVEIGGVAKAYPIRILDWHEIVNDSIGNQQLAVTYCPLCGTGVVFASNVGDSALVFGVSGLLYNSDVLLYDRNTESLWSQLMGQAISGRLKGVKLPQIPAFHTTWGEWRTRFPKSEVLSIETGYQRDYHKKAYAGYEKSRRLYFSVTNKAPKDYHPKEQVMGVEVDGVFKAYPFKELSVNEAASFADTVNGKSLVIHWNESAKSAHVTDSEGRDVVSTTAFWFAWFTFHPMTEVFKPK